MKEDARNMNDQPDRFELFRLEDGEEKYAIISTTTAPFHYHCSFLLLMLFLLLLNGCCCVVGFISRENRLSNKHWLLAE